MRGTGQPGGQGEERKGQGRTGKGSETREALGLEKRNVGGKGKEGKGFGREERLSEERGGTDGRKGKEMGVMEEKRRRKG